MADLPVTPVAHDDLPADADKVLDDILTDGIHRAPKGEGLREARLAPSMSGALLFSGTVLPMSPEILTDAERERIIRAFGD